MTRLSDLLKQNRRLTPSVPSEPPGAQAAGALREPFEVSRAAENIRRRWPDVDAVGPEINTEMTDEDVARLLASQVDDRIKDDDWRGFSWEDVRRTAVAFLDHALWRESRFERLLGFLLCQIGPGKDRPANGPYVRTMFRKYIETYKPASTATRRLAQTLKRHWADAMLPIRSLVDQLHVFDLEEGPSQKIAEYMESQEQPFRALREVGMEAPHGPGLMQAAHRNFVSRLEPRISRGELSAVQKLLDWMDPPDHRGSLYGVEAGEAIDALLLPWRTHEPEPALRELLQGRLVKAYRHPGPNKAGAWSACKDEARHVMLRWLAEDTIQVFFDIVTRADSSHMWSDRKSFWIDLYGEGRITQAWFALSRKGKLIAQHLDLKLEFAENTSKSRDDRHKCLLIMNIYGRWVVEGSHDFPTLVFPRGCLKTFKPYEKGYKCEKFRNVRGPEKSVRIVHLGDWSNKVLAALQG